MNAVSDKPFITHENIRSLAFFTSVAALGGFLFGFDTAVISGTINALRDKFQLDSMMEGSLVSSALVGCIVGALLAGPLSDTFGRKKILILSAVLFLISAIGSSVPNTVSTLMTARVVGGLGVGMASMLSPLYISEYSPAALRGRMVSLYQLAIVIGILIAYFSNALIVMNAEKYASGSMDHGFWSYLFLEETWRGMFFVEAIPAALFLVLMFFIPESPRWLANQGQKEKAVSLLSKVIGTQEAQKEIDDLGQLLSIEKSSVTELLKPSMRLPLLIGILLPFFSQVTGINVIIYYGTSIFKEAGLGIHSSFGAQVLVGFINMLFTVIAIWKVDRFGRKPLLLTGSLALSLILLLLGILFSRGGTTSFVVPLLFCLHVAFFAMSFGPVTWIVIAEIFPSKIRGRAMAVATFTIWISCALVSQTFPWLRDHLGTVKTFFIYAFFLSPSIWIIWYKIPETKQKTLEEIEQHWLADGSRL